MRDILGQLAIHLPGFRQSGRGLSGPCPNPHHGGDGDQNASFSLFVGDGQPHAKCHAGCTRDDWLAHLPEAVQKILALNVNDSGGLTLAQYAKAKKLPEEFLRDKWDVRQVNRSGKPVVAIPFKSPDGIERAVQYRISLSGDFRHAWPRGTKLIPLGLDHLRSYPNETLAIVEGASDTFTLSYHGVSVLGLPSATFGLAPWVDELSRFRKILVVIEPDAGGEGLLRQGWLQNPKLRARIHLIFAGNWKDASGLHLKVGSLFGEEWRRACAQAVPLSQHLDRETAERKERLWQECREIAESPDIFALVAGDAAKRGVCGESNIIKTSYACLTSRLLDKPLCLKISGESSSGKSFLLDCAIAYFPGEAVNVLTGASARALIYSDRMRPHTVLVFREAPSVENEFLAMTLRSVISEGVIDYDVVEEVNGQFKTRHIKIDGPLGFITTTTLPSLDGELETRLIEQKTDDSEAQTARILESLAVQSISEREGLHPLAKFQALQEWLSLCASRVVIPFAPALASLISPAAVRLRRDFGQVLGVVRTSAVLHQCTRKRDSSGRIVAQLDDYGHAFEMLNASVCERVEAGVSQAVRETVAAVADAGEAVSITKLSIALKLNKSTVKHRVDLGLAKGYLKNEEIKDGRPFRLTVGDPLPEPKDLLPSPQKLLEALEEIPHEADTETEARKLYEVTL